MSATPGKAFPTPGIPGAGLGRLATSPMRPLTSSDLIKPMQPLKAMDPTKGTALQPGQAAAPTGQTALNPWGQNRGGSGMLPLYRRPGTMPGFSGG